MDLSATYLAPTSRAKALNTTDTATLVFQNNDRPIDHAISASISVGRAKVGATMGKVLRPMSLSPSVSLKSCACIVVRKIPALAQTDMNAIGFNSW